MRLPPAEIVAKGIFVLSVAVLALVYGWLSQAKGWFPDSLLTRARGEVRLLTQPPGWVEPKVYDRVGVRVVDPDGIQPGLTLIAGTWPGYEWKAGLKLIDRDGRVLHGWRVDPRELRPPEELPRRYEVNLIGTHLFPNGDILLNVDAVGTVRLDACGRLRWRLSALNHHSIARVEDGSFWIPSGTSEDSAWRPDIAPENAFRPDSFPGLGKPARQDLLLHVSEEGEVLDAINVLDVLYENGLERHVAKSGRRSWAGITHLNDVEPLPSSMAADYPLFEAGDLVVSLKNLDLVLVVDPRSRRVKWHESHPFIAQHDPDFLGGGWIGVFDNNADGTARGTMLGGSRIVAVQPHTDSTRILFPTPRSEPLYTKAVGQWQRLGNGNLLLTESFAGRVVEVASDGRTVWDWVSEPYNESMVPEIYGATRHDLSSDEVASWPCSPGDSTDHREESDA